jgi:uncharacterized protein (TIGR02594 family)
MEGSEMNTKDIQTRLAGYGYNPGPIDGIWGRRTMAAVKAYQAAVGLVPDGIVGPKTIAVMFNDPKATVAVPPWYAIAKTKLGLSEALDNSKLRKFLASDGAALGDPAKLPWCGDFVETCVALALPEEVLPTNPYYALNWLGFGRKLIQPSLGCVAVFKRKGGGHVAFVAGHDAGYVHTLGGNQSNRVSITKVSKSMLQGYRWPLTYGDPGPTLGYETLEASISGSRDLA